MNKIENIEIFTTAFLKALSNWQRGWSENQEKRRLIADELVKQCENYLKNLKKLKLIVIEKDLLLAEKLCQF